MIRRLNLILLPIAIAFLLIFYLFFYEGTMENSAKRGMCRAKERALNINFSGTLSKKYIDNRNHLNETIVISLSGNNFITTFLAAEQSGFYDKIDLGDSLTKKTGSLRVFVHHNGLTREYLLDFCATKNNLCEYNYCQCINKHAR